MAAKARAGGPGAAHYSLTRAQVDDLIARAKAHGPHLEPITQALRLGFAMMVVGQHVGPFRLPSPKRRKPVITIIGDDLHEALGPDAFHRPSLCRLLRGACGVAVVSSGPETGAYYMATARGVLLKRDVLIIETRLEKEFSWV